MKDYVIFSQAPLPEVRSLATLVNARQVSLSVAKQIRDGTRQVSAAVAPALEAYCADALERSPMDELSYFLLEVILSGSKLMVLSRDPRFTTLPEELARAPFPCALLADSLLVPTRYASRASTLLTRLRSAMRQEQTQAQHTVFELLKEVKV